jgi:hypothetical protein
LFFRADYLRNLWLEASNSARDAGSDLSLEGGHGIPIWVLTTLHLAGLYTVLEGWRRLGLTDPTVDRLLADVANLQKLLELRNGVFHFGAINNPAILDVMGDTRMLSWARDLHDAIGAFINGAQTSGAA